MKFTSADIIALSNRVAGRAREFRGASRTDWMDGVWDMYERTYRSIGMHIPNPSSLLKYQLWELTFEGDAPVAFNLYKVTPYGFKSGLSGHDGSARGKAVVLKGIRTKFKERGRYGEVSHKVRDIAIAAGSPGVCPSDAEMVLGKRIYPTKGIAYKRNLRGIGLVEKVMLGRPKGVHVTDPKHPDCDIGRRAYRDLQEGCDYADLDAELSCVMVAMLLA